MIGAVHVSVTAVVEAHQTSWGRYPLLAARCPTSHYILFMSMHKDISSNDFAYMNMQTDPSSKHAQLGRNGVTDLIMCRKP